MAISMLSCRVGYIADHNCGWGFATWNSKLLFLEGIFVWAGSYNVCVSRR